MDKIDQIENFMRTQKAAQPALPEELFHAVAALVTRLIYISEEECGLQPIQLLILWHIRHFGKVNLEDETVIPRQSLTVMLKGKFQYTDGAISKLLAELQDKGFIVRTAVSTQERVALFGGQGDTRVVILNAKGKLKIEDFKEQIRSRAQRWLTSQPGPTRAAVRAFRPIVERFARWLVERYESDRLQTLYPSDQRK